MEVDYEVVRKRSSHFCLNLHKCPTFCQKCTILQHHKTHSTDFNFGFSHDLNDMPSIQLTTLKIERRFKIDLTDSKIFTVKKRCVASTIKIKPQIEATKTQITFYRGFMHTYIMYCMCHHTFRLINATLFRVAGGIRSVLGPF